MERIRREEIIRKTRLITMNDDLKTQLIERITELLNASNFETVLPREENVRLARAQARASTVLERLTGVEFQFEIKEEELV